MAEIIETNYTDAEVVDLRASGHWPNTDELVTSEEAEQDRLHELTTGEPETGESPDVDPNDIV